MPNYHMTFLARDLNNLLLSQRESVKAATECRRECFFLFCSDSIWCASPCWTTYGIFRICSIYIHPKTSRTRTNHPSMILLQGQDNHPPSITQISSLICRHINNPNRLHGHLIDILTHILPERISVAHPQPGTLCSPRSTIHLVL